MYRVKCKFERGIRRSGKHWPSTWTETDEVMQEMRDDPGLIIEHVADTPVSDEFVDEVEEPSAEVEPIEIAPLYVSDKPSRGRPTKRR